jgi:hypothetical protein
VELQLLHAPEIKYTIDRAWGVVHNKHKKKDSVTAPPDASDPKSQESLQQLPLGQDIQRKRYWVADGPCTTLSPLYLLLFALEFNSYGRSFYHLSISCHLFFSSQCFGLFVITVAKAHELNVQSLVYYRFSANLHLNQSMEGYSYISIHFIHKRGIPWCDRGPQK